MHEHAVQMTSFDISNFYGFVAPAHYLAGAYVCDGCRHFAPLQHDILGHLINDTKKHWLGYVET